MCKIPVPAEATAGRVIGTAPPMSPTSGWVGYQYVPSRNPGLREGSDPPS
jgi:hypothetical protein